jgi:hypothetical protein
MHNVFINAAMAAHRGVAMRTLARLGLAAVAAATLATLAGAGPAATRHADAAADDAVATGRVRVVHLSPDAPPVDIVVNGAPAVSGLAFKEASDYAGLPAGIYDVAVTPAGANETIVLGAHLPINAGTDATVVALGTLDALDLLVLADDNTAPAFGNAKVRFVHASPDAPAVDIAVKGGPVLFANVPFKGVGDYAEVPAGAYDLEVRVAGTDTVALELPGVTLEDGQIVTVFAAGLLADGTLGALPIAYPAAPIAID